MPEYDVQELQLVRRLDKRIIPVLVFLYLASVIDTGTQFHARVTKQSTRSGAQLDLGATDRSFALALVAYGISSFLFVGPSTFGFRKFGPAKWFAGMLSVWGLITAAAAATQSMPGWVFVKVLLGGLQAGFLPGIMLYILSFYTREEWATRMSWVVSSATIAEAFLGVFADWGTQFDGAAGLGIWRWMFVCNGVFSMVAGVTAFILLPDYPETCHFLTPADRVLAIARGHDGSEGGHAHDSDDDAHRQTSLVPKLRPPRIKFATGQLFEAVTDARNWLFAGAFFSISVTLDVLVTLGPEVAAASFTLTSAFLESNENDPTAVAAAIEAAETGTRHARMVAAIPFLIGGLTAYVCAWNSDRTGDRALHATIPLMVSSVGFAILAFVPVSATGAGLVRYVLGLLPATAGVVAAFPCLLSYALDKAQGDTSRVAVAAMTFSFGQAFSPALASPGSLLLPDPASTSVHAVGAGICAIGIAFSAFCVLLIRWLYRREETQMWGKGPGLRRLLNDADEGKAWDVELSQADMFVGGEERRLSRGRKASVKVAGAKRADRRDSDWDLQQYATG